MLNKMIMATVLGVLVGGVFTTQAAGATLFEDDFNTSPLNPAKWTNATNGWTAVSGSQLIVRNKEEIITQTTFDATSLAVTYSALIVDASSADTGFRVNLYNADKSELLRWRMWTKLDGGTTSSIHFARLSGGGSVFEGTLYGDPANVADLRLGQTVEISVDATTVTLVYNGSELFSGAHGLGGDLSAMTMGITNDSNQPRANLMDDVLVTQVPEPMTLALLAIGGAVLARRRR